MAKMPILPYLSGMSTTTIPPKILKAALRAQKVELTESLVYERLARRCKTPHNKEILLRIAKEEQLHAQFWQARTGQTVKPSRRKIILTVLLARLLGLTFVLKRMEGREGTGSRTYQALAAYYPEAQALSDDESRHEKELLGMLDEELLQYVGSIVLGLNDALVELTGALAGFTLALGDTKVIALAGSVTGISAAFSMAASDYLSSKAENDPRAAKSALYTGVAYFLTVILLVTPFLVINIPFLSLGITLATAVLIIFCFNYYLSVAKELNFRRRFLEMTFISLGVAAFSFFIGYLLKQVLGVDA